MTKEELNAQLLDVCLADEVDYARAEELLRLGAEPLGRIEPADSRCTSTPNNLYDEVVDWFCNDETSSKDFYRITELFLRYGMDISKPSVPYGDFGNDVVQNPMWVFAHLPDDRVLPALKLLLDYGLSADDAAECRNHVATDLLVFGKSGVKECGFDAIFKYARILFLIASYPDILNTDESLRLDIWYDSNHYDLMRFRRWDDFDLSVEVVPCEVEPDRYACAIVTFREKATGKEVWQFGVELWI